MSTLPEMSQAVTEALNAGPFGKAFTAVRSYAPSTTLQSIEDLTVFVRPSGLTKAAAAVDCLATEYRIDVILLRRFTGDQAEHWGDPAAADEMANLCEEIAAFLALTPIAGLYPVQVSTNDEAIADPEALREEGIWETAITATYRSTD